MMASEPHGVKLWIESECRFGTYWNMVHIQQLGSHSVVCRPDDGNERWLGISIGVHV